MPPYLFYRFFEYITVLLYSRAQKETRGRDLLLAAMRHLERHMDEDNGHSTAGTSDVHGGIFKHGLAAHYFGLRLANPLRERHNVELKRFLHQRGFYWVRTFATVLFQIIFFSR